jgi:hypothetical protein
LNDFKKEVISRILFLHQQRTKKKIVFLHKDFGFVWLRVCPAILSGAFFTTSKSADDNYHFNKSDLPDDPKENVEYKSSDRVEILADAAPVDEPDQQICVATLTNN